MWCSRPISKHLRRCQQTGVLSCGSVRMLRLVAGGRAALFWRQCRHAASSPMLALLSCWFGSASQFQLYCTRFQLHFRTEDPSQLPSILAEDFKRESQQVLLVQSCCDCTYAGRTAGNTQEVVFGSWHSSMCGHPGSWINSHVASGRGGAQETCSRRNSPICPVVLSSFVCLHISHHSSSPQCLC